MKRIQVGLGERSYPIIINDNMLSGVGAYLAKLDLANRYVLVADDYVAELFSHTLLDSFKKAGLDASIITFPRGESSKNMATVADLASLLARLGMDRKDALVALGGGVTGDITGFLAAVYMRGIPFVQVPTSLLAQVDSSVGGKTGVDIKEGKNLVGVFYQPKAVYIDPRVLRTLPKIELLNGLAEVIKYGVIYDRDFFDFIDENRQAILNIDLEVIEELIGKCCSIKAEVVAADEREADLRRILNFGHTIGHAVEAASDFSIAHGQGVAMGMIAAAKVAAGKGLFRDDEAQRLRALVEAFGLPVDIPPELSRTEIKEYLKTDKKAVSGRPFFVLPTTIGKVVITDDIDEALIGAAIR